MQKQAPRQSSREQCFDCFRWAPDHGTAITNDDGPLEQDGVRGDRLIKLLVAERVFREAEFLIRHFVVANHVSDGAAQHLVQCFEIVNGWRSRHVLDDPNRFARLVEPRIDEFAHAARLRAAGIVIDGDHGHYAWLCLLEGRYSTGERRQPEMFAVAAVRGIGNLAGPELHRSVMCVVPTQVTYTSALDIDALRGRLVYAHKAASVVESPL